MKSHSRTQIYLTLTIKCSGNYHSPMESPICEEGVKLQAWLVISDCNANMNLAEKLRRSCRHRHRRRGLSRHSSTIFTVI